MKVPMAVSTVVEFVMRRFLPSGSWGTNHALLPKSAIARPEGLRKHGPKPPNNAFLRRSLPTEGLGELDYSLAKGLTRLAAHSERARITSPSSCRMSHTWS